MNDQARFIMHIESSPLLDIQWNPFSDNQTIVDQVRTIGREDRIFCNRNTAFVKINILPVGFQ